MVDTANKPGLTGHLNIDLERRVVVLEETGGGGGGGGGFTDVIDPAFPYTAAAGERVIDTAGMATHTVTLPLGPSVGDRVAVYATNSTGMLTLNVARNGELIGGVASDDVIQGAIPASATLRAGTIYCFVGGSVGWLLETQTQ